MWLVGDDYAQRHRTDAIYITIDFAFVDNTRMILVFSPFYLYHCVLYPYFLILWTHVSVCLCISCFWWKGKVCFWIGHGQTLVAVFWSLFFFFFLLLIHQVEDVNRKGMNVFYCHLFVIWDCWCWIYTIFQLVNFLCDFYSWGRFTWS